MGGLKVNFQVPRGLLVPLPIPILLNCAGKHGVFEFHPECRRIQSTQSCFANDLLVLAKGTVESIVAIKENLDYFYHKRKSDVSLGMSQLDLQQIMELAGS